MGAVRGCSRFRRSRRRPSVIPRPVPSSFPPRPSVIPALRGNPCGGCQRHRRLEMTYERALGGETGPRAANGVGFGPPIKSGATEGVGATKKRGRERDGGVVWRWCCSRRDTRGERGNDGGGDAGVTEVGAQV